jgi:hypothetical protein
MAYDDKPKASKKKGGMTDSELSALLEAEQVSALGYLGGDLSDARKKAMEYYLGELFGNEVDGRSKVVSTDVADTIEWILPSLIKMFTAGDDVVSFEPQGQEDEEGAKQATEYNNWIFLKDNPGFTILYSMFKDALLQRTGACKVYPEFNETEELDEFVDVPDDQFSVTALEKQQDNEKVSADYAERGWKIEEDKLWYLKEHNEEQVIPEAPPEQAQQMAQAGMPAPPPMPITVHSGVWCRTVKRMKICIDPMPPEETLISKRARGDIDEPVYMAHRTQKTASELIEMGYPKAKIDKMGGDGPGHATDQEKTARVKGIDDDPSGDYSTINHANRLIWVTEAYVKVDYDGDGIAEMRRVVHAGNGCEVLENDEWEGPRPFAVITPIIVPHRLIGLSVADQTMEFQLLSSTLWRQTLDNMYLVNTPQKYIDPSSVNLDDILQPRVGGIVRPPPGGSFRADGIVPIMTPSVLGEVFPMFEYIDTKRENRTGVTKYNQGVDANSLNKTASGITQIMSASQQRIELIARVFAEGIKRIFMLQQHFIRRYPDLAKRAIRLRNKQWVEIDPSQWGADFDLQINVGLGTGNKDQMLGHLMSIAGIQKEIVALQQGVQGPLVTAQNIYNVAAKVVENSGFKNPEEFFSDPQNTPPPEPQPDPEIELKKAELQMKQEEAQMDMQAKQQEAQMDAQIEQQKLDAEIEAMQIKAQTEYQLEILRIQNEEKLALMELNIKAQSGFYKPKPAPQKQGAAA